MNKVFMSGGGFGALDSMNKTIKNNLSLLKRRRGFDKVKEHNLVSSKRTIYQYKRASKEDIKRIRKILKNRFWVNTIKTFFSFVIAVALVCLLLNWLI